MIKTVSFKHYPNTQEAWPVDVSVLLLEEHGLLLNGWSHDFKLVTCLLSTLRVQHLSTELKTSDGFNKSLTYSYAHLVHVCSTSQSQADIVVWLAVR